MDKQEFTGKVHHTLFQIVVTIDAPELRTEMGGASKHHEYRIYGIDEVSEFDVWRRYSDFVILKQHMTARWPGIYIPSLPEKKFLGNNQMSFLDNRRQGLQNFLKLIAAQKYLWYGDEFQLFIKSKSHEVDKFLGNLGKTNNRQIAAKFRTKFPQILDSTVEQKSTESNTKVAQFRNYLKNAQIVLEKLTKVSDLMAQARKRYNQRYDILLGTTLPAYEQKCITEYTQNKEALWFMNNKVNGLAETQINLTKLSSKNSLSIVNELIKDEIREIINFQQLLKNKQEFQSSKLKAMGRVKDLEIEQTKINAGKESLLNKIKNASKQQQQQENKVQLEKAREDQKDAEQICKVIDRMLAADQIAIFKQARQNNYYKVIKEMAKVEKQNCSLQEEFWGKIANQGFLVEPVEKQQAQVKVEQVKSEKKQEVKQKTQEEDKEQEHYDAMLKKVKESDQEQIQQ